MTAQAQVSPDFGTAALRIWDVDGDGIRDWIVSDPGADGGKGKLFILEALPGGGMKPVQDAHSTFSNDDAEFLRIGEALKFACDADGDGFAEVLVACEYRDGQTIYPATFWFNARTGVAEGVTILPREGFPEVWAQLPGSCDDLSDRSGIQPAGPPDATTQAKVEAKVQFAETVYAQMYYALPVLVVPGSYVQTAQNYVIVVQNTLAASSWAEAQFSGNAGQQNAAQHCYWQALLTNDLGSWPAEFIGNVHEAPRFSSGRTDSWIDQYNNRVGRQLGQQGLSDAMMRSQIGQMVEDGTLITDSCNDSRIPANLKDCNGDGKPDCPDTPEPDPVKRADVNRDGRVDFDDVQIVADDVDPDAPEEPVDDPSLDQDGDCGTTVDDVVIVIGFVGEYVEP